MNWLDFTFLGIMVGAVISGFARGLARTVVGLAATVLGVVFATQWYSEVGMFLRDYLSTRALANATGFLIILFLFMIAGGVLGWMLAKAFKWVGVGWLDRALGGGFGVVQGALLCIALVMIGMAFPRTPLPHAIIQSRYAPYVTESAKVLAAITPDEIKDAFAKNYDEVKKIWSDVVPGKAGKLPETQI